LKFEALEIPEVELRLEAEPGVKLETPPFENPEVELRLVAEPL
jgi:hypothetical protein